jgi:hypothetical protein
MCTTKPHIITQEYTQAHANKTLAYVFKTSTQVKFYVLLAVHLDTRV